MTPKNIPQHIAIIMDGNGRWAKARGKPRTSGHKIGVERAREIVEAAGNLGIRSITLFAFSSENWQRPPEEVTFLMELFVVAINREVKKLNQLGIKIKFIGDSSAFNTKLQKSIQDSEQLTQNNQRLYLNVAANYGGHWDIINAANQCFAEQPTEKITADALQAKLATAELPPLDLLIRTGGEKRISNFLIWQAAYAELYFCETLWPDFDAKALRLALDDYAQRQRRFGLTGEQIETVSSSVD